MRKVRHLMVVLTTLACLALVGAGCTAGAKKARHLARANRYYDAGEYEKAELEYRKVLRIDPENVQAFSHLGFIYFDQGRLSRAAAFVFKARDLNTNNVDLRLKTGLIFLMAGKLKEARVEDDFVLQKRPQDQEAPLLLADLARTPQEIDAARQRLLTMPVPASNRAPCEVALGTLALRQHDLKAAEDAFERAKALDPKFSPAYSALGSLYLAQKDNAKAGEAFKTAADLSPIRSPKRLNYAQFKIQTGDVPGGKRILEDLAKRAPDYAPALLELAQTAAREKKNDECDAWLDKVLARDPDNYDALFLKAGLALAVNPASAVPLLEKITGIYPGSAQAFYELGVARLAANETVKGLADLNHSLALNPKPAGPKLVLAEYKIRNGDFDSAIVSLRKLVEEEPKLAKAQFLLASAYLAKDDPEDALKVYDQLRRSFPGDPQIPLLMGRVLAQKKQPDAARQAFEAALKLSPGFLPALEQLVNLLTTEHQYPQAVERIQQELERNPQAAEARVLLATVYEKQLNTNQAEVELTKAIESQPDSRAAYIELARLYVTSGRQKQALEDLDRVLAKNPKDEAALMLAGMIHDEGGEYEKARDLYEKLLAVNPKYSPALNNLAYLYSEKLGQLEKAYAMARRARELLPDDPSTADTVGWILHKRGQEALALAYLQESANLLPSEPEVQFHLGMAHYNLGDEDAARVAFQRALQLKKQFPGKDECSRRLAFLEINASAPGTDARASLEKRTAEEPNDTIAVFRLAAVYERAGAVDKALTLYQAALKANPENIRALINLARLYSTQPDQAKKAFEFAKAAYKLAPDDPLVSHILGRLAYQTGDFKWALGLLQESQRKQPQDPDLLYDLAQAAYSMGQVADASAAMRGALEIRPDFSHAAQARLFLEMTGSAASPASAPQAAARAEQALKSDSNYVPALMVQGAVAGQKADVGAAKQAYEKVLQRYPDFVPAKRQLAILYAENPGDDARAYQLATKAREAFPDDPEVAKALGIIVYRQGDYAGAARLLQESASAQSEDAELMYYLGMAQYHLNQKGGGKKSLQRALDLHLADKLAGEAKRAITEMK